MDHGSYEEWRLTADTALVDRSSIGTEQVPSKHQRAGSSPAGPATGW